jgi:hypothetical protein
VRSDERQACAVGCRKGAKTSKKRRVEMSDAPSNRTFGNCLLGFHCSQNTPLEAAPMLDLRPLRHANSRNPSTSYPQCCAVAAQSGGQTWTLRRIQPKALASRLILPLT